MKKNYFIKGLSILFLSLFVSVTTYAQLGTDIYTLGLDNANNYGGTWNETSAGTGFGDWVFDTYAGDGGGGFAGRFTGSFSAALDVSSNSFGLFANSQNNTTSGATRSLPQNLQEGDVFKISVGVNFRDGAKGFDLRDASNSTIVNFNVGSDKYTIAGVDLFSDAYDANTVITFTFTQNATSLDWTADRTGGLTGTQSGTINSINAGTITNLRLYNVSSGTNGDGGSGQRNLYFNSLEFTSKYTINNNSTVAVSSDTTVPYLTVESGSTVNIGTTSGVLVSGNLDNSGTLNVASGSSLRVNGTSSGNITYNRTIGTTNWYLISSPVIGQDIDAFVTAEGLAPGINNTDHRGLGDYNNTTPAWVYYENGDSGTGNFTSGDGRSLKLAASGDITFTGTMSVADVGIAINTNTNGFNLVGNPYPSYLAANTNADATNNILKINDTDNDFLTESTIWLWDQVDEEYDEVNLGTASKHIAPGQGFFVSSNGSNTFSFTEAMQSHQSDSFQKSANTRTELQLVITDGTNKKDADIFYIDGTSTGFDNGYDSSIFGGVNTDFSIYTSAVANGTGKKLGIQALPNSNLESMVIPVGVKASSGEITFSVNVSNLPSGLKVFLEDRLENTFTRIDEVNSEYKVTLTDNLDGIGRFYLHTKSSILGTDNIKLENVSIYKSNNSTLRIVGLSSGKSNVKMFNIIGKQVFNTSFKSTGVSDIKLPQLSTGVYIVQLQNKAGKLNKKIVLE